MFDTMVNSLDLWFSFGSQELFSNFAISHCTVALLCYTFSSFNLLSALTNEFTFSCAAKSGSNP